MSDQTTSHHGSGPVGVAVVGTGMISREYLQNMLRFPDLRVVAVGNRDVGRGQRVADEFGIGFAGSVDEAIGHDEVDLVVDLTIPEAHAPVAAQAIRAGKHVWNEKPLTTDLDSAQRLLGDADRAGVLVGVAPDTVLGPAFQTARRIIERGDIGEVLFARTAMQYAGPDLFHPNPAFLFAPGAGPLFDVGPYYLTALVDILGSVSSVAAVATSGRPRRRIQVGERAGEEFDVRVPSHVSAVLRFASGGVADSTFSFESPLTRMGVVEVSGTEGTIVLADPNQFVGAVRVTTTPTFDALAKEPEWTVVEAGEPEVGRGLGVLDLARAARSGRTPLASGALGYHVLDVMTQIQASAADAEARHVTSTAPQVPITPLSPGPFDRTL